MLRKIRNLLSRYKEEEPQEETKVVYIWAVIDGPFEDEDLGAWALIVKAEVDGDLIFTELYFQHFNQAYDFKNQVDWALGPVEFEIPLDAEVAESERKCLKQQ